MYGNILLFVFLCVLVLAFDCVHVMAVFIFHKDKTMVQRTCVVSNMRLACLLLSNLNLTASIL